MRYEDLSVEQRSVTENVLLFSRTLVIGPPGSGKTTAALWAARQIIEASGPSSRVLFLTFSRAATDRIAERSPGILTSIKDCIEIHTFHGLAYRFIQSFKQYLGFGDREITVVGSARANLTGGAAGLRYDDLIPLAMRVVGDQGVIGSLVRSRWMLLICDEVQDTSDVEWDFLNALSVPKSLLLGDPDQMIYTFKKGVSQTRFEAIQTSADSVIRLPPVSFRDPTGIIPACAKAVHERRFEAPEIKLAVQQGRLKIVTDVTDDHLVGVVSEEIRSYQRQRLWDISVFVHTNAAVMALAGALEDAGITSTVVGIGESHGEAMLCMATQALFASSVVDFSEVATNLAVFMTASWRGKTPPLARSMANNGDLPREVAQGLAGVRRDLEAGYQTWSGVMPIIAGSWRRLGIVSGNRQWNQAFIEFQRTVRRIVADDGLDAESAVAVSDHIGRLRNRGLLQSDKAMPLRAVKVMGFHQTKARESAATILVFRDDDFFGYEREPYPNTSKLMNVAFSRAQQRVTLILPPVPHGVIRPMADLA